jgi:hypothetical protein
MIVYHSVKFLNVSTKVCKIIEVIISFTNYNISLHNFSNPALPCKVKPVLFQLEFYFIYNVKKNFSTNRSNDPFYITMEMERVKESFWLDFTLWLIFMTIDFSVLCSLPKRLIIPSTGVVRLKSKRPGEEL